MRESGTRESREEQWHQGLMHASATFTVSLCLKAQASPLPSTACRSIKQCSAPIHHHTRVDSTKLVHGLLSFSLQDFQGREQPHNSANTV